MMLKKDFTYNYEVERLLHVGKNKRVIGLIKEELGRKIMTEWLGLTPKTYSYKTHDGGGDEKVEGRKKCIILQDNITRENKVTYNAK